MKAIQVNAVRTKIVRDEKTDANEQAFIGKALEIGGEELKEDYTKLCKARDEFVQAQEKTVPLVPNNYQTYVAAEYFWKH